MRISLIFLAVVFASAAFAEQHAETVLIRRDAITEFGSGSQTVGDGISRVLEMDVWNIGDGAGMRYDMSRWKSHQLPYYEIDTTYNFSEPPLILHSGESFNWNFEISLSGMSRHSLNYQGDYGLVLLSSNRGLSHLSSFRFLRVSSVALPLVEISDPAGNYWLYQGSASLKFPVSVFMEFLYTDFTLAVKLHSGPSDAFKAIVYWQYDLVDIPTGKPDPRIGTDAQNASCALATSYSEAELTGFIDQLSDLEQYSLNKISGINALLSQENTYLVPGNARGGVISIPQTEIERYAPELLEVAIGARLVDRTTVDFMSGIAQFISNDPNIAENMQTAEVLKRVGQVLSPIDQAIRARLIDTVTTEHNDLDSTREMAGKLIAERTRVRHYVQTGEVNCD